MRMPDELSIAVLGYNDPQQQASWSGPRPADIDWTMFRIPRREMGSVAIRTLVELLSGPGEAAPRQLLLPCEIVPGSSVLPFVG
jgi:DNA-binding LacI/PurR family transcriptional regulator